MRLPTRRFSLPASVRAVTRQSAWRDGRFPAWKVVFATTDEATKSQLFRSSARWPDLDCLPRRRSALLRRSSILFVEALDVGQGCGSDAFVLQAPNRGCRRRHGPARNAIVAEKGQRVRLRGTLQQPSIGSEAGGRGLACPASALEKHRHQPSTGPFATSRFKRLKWTLPLCA